MKLNISRQMFLRWTSRIMAWLNPAPAIEPAPVAPPTHSPDPVVGACHADDIHDILDSLPEYYKDIRALRRADPDLYEIFASIGGRLVGSSSLFSASEIPPEFIESAPAIRCVFIGKHEGGDSTTRAVSLLRVASGRVHVTQGGHVATPATGLSYRLSVVWRIKGKNWAALGECYVTIDGDGSVKIIPESHIAKQHLPSGNIVNGMRGGVVSHRRVGIPKWLYTASKECGRDMTPASYAQMCAAIAASAKPPEHAILVRSTLGTLTAAWTIDRRSAKHFFRKRDTGKTESGQRKRVLHYVEEHSRLTRGKETTVREHYRGERAFDWKGYKISIGGIGFHHQDFLEAPIETYDSGDSPPMAMATLRSTMRRVATHYDTPRFLKPKGRRSPHQAQPSSSPTAGDSKPSVA